MTWNPSSINPGRVGALHLIFAVILGALTSVQLQAQPVQVNPLSAATLYQGWRVSALLGQPVISNGNKSLGRLRNVIISDQGQIKDLVIEGARSEGQSQDFVFRIPWSEVSKPDLPGRIKAEVSSSSEPAYEIFGSDQTSALPPGDFAVSEVIGDYARLQAGQGYGYVSDVVFTRDGQFLAILVTRGAAAGGGVHAFGFPGKTGRWNPHASYYGLPYVTAEQARSAAVVVDVSRFRSGGG